MYKYVYMFPLSYACLDALTSVENQLYDRTDRYIQIKWDLKFFYCFFPYVEVTSRTQYRVKILRVEGSISGSQYSIRNLTTNYWLSLMI